MSLRDQEFREICAAEECNGWAAGHCLRCARPLCDAHLPTPKHRCFQCESEFLQIRKTRKKEMRAKDSDVYYAVVFVFVAVWVVGGFIKKYLDAPLAVAVVATGGIIGILAILVAFVRRRWIHRTLRRRFRAERLRPVAEE